MLKPNLRIHLLLLGLSIPCLLVACGVRENTSTKTNPAPVRNAQSAQTLPQDIPPLPSEMEPNATKQEPDSTAPKKAAKDNANLARAHQLAVSANSLWNAGRSEQALPLYNQALSLWEADSRKPHKFQVLALLRIGRCAYASGEWRQAEGQFKKALDLPKARPEYNVQPMILLALAYTQEHRYGDAHTTLTRALAIQRQRVGPRNDRIALILTRLGIVSYLEGRYSEAEEHLAEAREIWKEIPSKSAAQTEAIVYLANIYLRQNKAPQAEMLLAEAIALRTSLRLPKDRLWVTALADWQATLNVVKNYPDNKFHSYSR